MYRGDFRSMCVIGLPRFGINIYGEIYDHLTKEIITNPIIPNRKEKIALPDYTNPHQQVLIPLESVTASVWWCHDPIMWSHSPIVDLIKTYAYYNTKPANDRCMFFAYKKDFLSLPDEYWVSRYGEVWKQNRYRLVPITKINTREDGHKVIDVGHKSTPNNPSSNFVNRYNKRLDWIVASCFIPIPKEFGADATVYNLSVKHKDGNKDNCHFLNLEWVQTKKEAR